MDTGAMRLEIETALKTINGLRVAGWGAQVRPPAALVTLPESVKFHQTMGVGSSRVEDLMVIVLVPRPNDTRAVEQLMPFVAETGGQSIKAKLESYAWTTIDDLTVLSVDFDVVTYQETPYLAAMFHTDIFGKGAI